MVMYVLAAESHKKTTTKNNNNTVRVFDAILTSRQTREKLQCLYENDFRRAAVLKKKMICKLKLHSKGFY